MSKVISIRVIYNRRDELDKNGKAPISIEAYHNGKRQYESTGIRLTPAQWDSKKNEVKGNPQLNRVIRESILEMENFIFNFSAKHNRPCTLADLKTMRQAVTPTREKLTFTTHFAQQLERDKPALGRFTILRRQLVLKRLTAFHKQPHIEFDAFTLDFVERYTVYLRTSQKLSTNTIHKEHQIIQRYLTNAIQKGLFESVKNPYNTFRPKLAKVNKIVLRPEEIACIEQLTFNPEEQHLAFYRDAFLFGYYTLLRISDVTQLRQSHLLNTIEGVALELKAKKTGKLNRLSLFLLYPTQDGPSKPERLVQKYSRTDNRPLFARSHVKINKYLKRVIEIAGITKPVSFHTSRHSGITNMHKLGIAPAIIQYIAQHESIQTTMGYTHLDQQDTSKALTNVPNWENI
ncbi:site-specific integrase [Spirosoma fluviale]|uniref:Site-specific recombinase XerD n=1 Tax=Spirosoma fluviale TaxID=1597977 RepID=A0A286FZA7_9BACT|nr:site-specific integrase [Spirosoma fluviale]SOD88538.1 Site-specific recombinase XerD [Spirosoma fluviale]